MSYTMTAQIIGAEELKQAFNRAPKIVQESLKKAIGKAAFKVESQAKELAPIQYGHLRGSIHTEGPTVMPENVIAKVGTNLQYAPYQEYGTGVYAGRGMITPKRARVLAWKDRGGQWHIAKAVKGVKGKFYFKKAKEGSLPHLTDFLKDALSEIISNLAK